MPDPELSERLWGKEWASGIRSTICPEANSNVKCETRIFGDYDRRSRRRSPLLFSPTASNSRTQWTGHGGEEFRTRVKVGNLRITEGFFRGALELQ